MTAFQKTVKYLAMAFAVALAIGIFSLIAGVLGSVFGGLSGGFGGELMDVSRSFDGVSAIDIDSAAGELVILRGERAAVEAHDVTDKFTCELRDGVLTIRNRWNGRIGLFDDRHTKITVTLPQGLLDSAVIENAAGKTTVSALRTRELTLSAGAGECELDGLYAESGTIKGGAGEITIVDAELYNMTLSAGVGEITVDGILGGESTVKCGVGSARLTLRGGPEEYYLDISTGLGDTRIDGVKVSNGKQGDPGAENRLKIKGGVGEISLDFD